jgi:SAM-dependent methyltransferase
MPAVLNYDAEADRYDATRGGAARGQAAADAVLDLLPGDARVLVDVGCGTGVVTQYVVRPSLTVIGVEPSRGMATKAATRLPVILGSAERLPLHDDTVDAVSLIWILHLLDDPRPAIAEIARVLRPGGALIATVDKDAGHVVGSDIDALLAPYRRGAATDDFGRICGYARECDLIPVGETAFAGRGMGLSPRDAAQRVRDGYFASALNQPGAAARGIPADAADLLARALEDLPEPSTPRPEPVFRLVAFHKRRPLAS